MESELSPDKEIPPVPLKTYQWEDLRRARDVGGYPWTHLLKPPLEGDITAEDILRETTPRRSMSREFSRSRTRSPVDLNGQKILNLDSSPGSSRRHGEEGEDEGVHIPNFSKEVSLDSDEDVLNKALNEYVTNPPETIATSQLTAPIQVPKNISPKSILKRRVPEQSYTVATETREKTKCCHPLVNKIKHLADKTLHKFESEKSPLSKRKKNEMAQEIRDLKSSPGAVRRQKFSAIKLGDSDEMSKTLSVEATPPQRQKKEHIYEDIEELKVSPEKSLQFLSGTEDNIAKNNDRNISNKEVDSFFEKKSIASQDPSLINDENNELKPEEHVMEKLHKAGDISKEALLLDEEMDDEEPNVDEVFQNQLEEVDKSESPNITITEIIDDGSEPTHEISIPIIESSPSPLEDIGNRQNIVADIQGTWSKTNRRWTSEGGAPLEKPLRPTREGSVQSYTPDVRCACQFFQSDSLLPERLNPIGTRPTSQASNFMTNISDHEYEIIEKPPPNMVYTIPNVDEKLNMVKTDDELSSTTSLERKYLQHTSDEEELEDKENLLNENKDDGVSSAEALQKDIEDRFFVNTPSTVSRTECEVSTSQVDSSALENLPLKRENRQKNPDSIDSKIQQRLREGTGKLKSQAGKLKTKLQNMKTKQFSMPERPKINFPDRPKFKMPERPKISFPDRPKFSLPDRRKFSLPDRPKFKKINISEKLSLGDRKKFTLPERPKFNVPDLTKFKLPDRPKINFSSLGRKKEHKIDPELDGSNSNITNVASVEFENTTYPRLFSRKKKSETITTSSPSLNRDDTPPPDFTFTKMKPILKHTIRPESPEEPREYGNTDESDEIEMAQRKNYDKTYDFDRVDEDYNEGEPSNLHDIHNSASASEISQEKQEYTHYINEINNDEFFVRPRGISRENIQVREYLSDEIRQAFKIPKNALALMGSTSGDNLNLHYDNEEADPELLLDDNEPIRYSNEDLNDKDDGYYTFPPVRPSRAKRKKKEIESVDYIDEHVNGSIQFSEVDLKAESEEKVNVDIENDENIHDIEERLNCNQYSSQQLEHQYENDDIEYIPDGELQTQTLPMPPRRKRKTSKMHSSLGDFKHEVEPVLDNWIGPPEQPDDIIVYRTEHIISQSETIVSEQSPIAPRRSRNRSRSSHGTSYCDDDRTSHGAESLTLDTNIPQLDEIEREIRHESPGYATIDKKPFPPSKTARRSKSKTPPVRRRKSNSSERKYYTVGYTKNQMPDRPPRKKSSTSLITLDSIAKRSNGDITQYDEIAEPHHEEIHKELISGEIVNKMKDRPLPPPPRPPRGPKGKKKSFEKDDNEDENAEEALKTVSQEEVVEIEVSTQTDPLPDDVDYELGMEENLDISMSSSLRDIDEFTSKSLTKLETTSVPTSRPGSRPTSRSEKSLKFSDPKISELSKSTLGRTSPTVILVERRVSSPTRINEHEEMVTEASLTVHHIDVDESQVPDIPPLPISLGGSSKPKPSKVIVPTSSERTLERVSDSSREIQLDNLITQRLQVRDLDVGRLNVSELQASKILVSDIEGMSLQVTELDSKSGHLSVSGIEFSQNVIDEIVKKFTELSASRPATQPEDLCTGTDQVRCVSRSEETQTDNAPVSEQTGVTENNPIGEKVEESTTPPPPPPPRPVTQEGSPAPPQRPPLPDLTPLLYSYLQDLSIPPASLYHVRPPRDRPFTEFHESQHQSPPPPTRRVKRRPTTPHTESSSDDSKPRPSPRRIPPPMKSHEPTITEAGAQFFRVCHSSISRTIRNIFHSFMSYISGTEDKRDVQMALVIFLVLVAGLIMFGLSDSRTIHHHHWEFFNPPDTKP